MSTCTDNPRIGLVGCGATYGGERQHCVARVDWSEHPDGRAHITGAQSTIDACWRDGALRHPADRGYIELAPGRWGRERPDYPDVVSESDETAPDGPGVRA